MSFDLIKKAIEDQGKAFESFRETNDARIEALAKGNDSLAKELEQKLGKIETDLTAATKLKKAVETEIELQRERIEELEARSKNPGKTPEQKLKDEYKDNWLAWMRAKGQSMPHEQKMQELMKKDVTIGTASAGGYAVPEEISREVQRLERKTSPVRDLVKVVQVGSSDYKELISIGATTTSGWVGETGSRTATNTPTLRECAPTHGELYAYPQVSEWSLDDMFFNVEQWLIENIAEEFAIQEADAVLTGSGTNKPTGMLNTTPVTTADDASPLRAAAAYQYFAQTSDSSPAAVQADNLFDLIYGLNARYRAGSYWAMNSTTVGQVRKLKDNNNQYLWQPSLQAGQPDQLAGYPVSTWEQMADPNGGNFPLAFGNFRKAYTLADRVGMRITRDNVTNIGYVRFYVRRREGGIVTNNDALKWLKLA